MSPGAADAVLVRAAQNGEVGSLGVLLERHRARLLAIAVGILGHGPQAEDAVQDACLTAVSRIGDLRDPTAARAWLATIVTNACRARLRRGPIERPAETDEPLPGAGVDSVEQAIERLALRDWVWTALERLSEPLRLVVVLRYFTAANSYAAIAELCGVPVGTRAQPSERGQGEAGGRVAANRRPGAPLSGRRACSTLGTDRGSHASLQS